MFSALGICNATGCTIHCKAIEKKEIYQVSNSKTNFSLYMNIPQQTFSKSKVQENILSVPEVLTSRV